MSTLTTIEKRCFEELFGMASGYVLDFNNQSFAQLFIDNIKLDINDPKYCIHGSSKAQRLRGFWEIESDVLVGKVLSVLLEIWKRNNNSEGQKELAKSYSEAKIAVARLLGEQIVKEETEQDFLLKEFEEIKITNLKIEPTLIPILEERLKESIICLKYGLSLSVIFMCGSILEGLLLSLATQNPQKFNESKVIPKNRDGKVKQFQDWTLANFIDVSHDLEYIGKDVNKFSHVLRDFRNYIHPYQQMISNFNPDNHTAKICMQVLKAAIADIHKNNL